ncbi:MAG: PQQ-binding-like beta-propeller repeat protein [Planctomycetaceae bacterium]|nr:PQQ-binding-like beta-propeller repeat protein [Planctomycetaceae bacterium]
MTFLTDVGLSAAADRIQKAASNGDWAKVSEAIPAFLAPSPEQMVETDGRFLGPAVFAEQFFQGLPIAGQDAFVRRLENSAVRELEQAIADQDLAALQAVANRYRLAPSGKRAQKLVGLTYLDQGQLAQSRWSLELAGESTDFLDPLTTPSGERPQRIGTVEKTEATPSSWAADAGFTKSVQEVVPSLDHYLRINGIAPLPVWDVAVAGDRVVLSNGWDLRCFDRLTGKLQWQRSPAVTSLYKDRDVQGLGDSNVYRQMSWEFGHLAFRETLQTGLGVFENTLHLVESVPEADQAKLNNPDQRRVPLEKRKSFPANRLLALNLETGEELWRQAGRQGDNLCLLSVPTVMPHGLFVLAESEKRRSIDLLRLDPRSGKILQSDPIGKTLVPLAEDLSRHGVNCHLQPSGPFLFGQTAAGGVFQFDTLREELTWASRYPGKRATPLIKPLEIDPLELRFHDLAGWREAQTLLFEDAVVFAMPDTDHVQVHDQRTGRLRWRAPREDGLFLVLDDTNQAVVTVGHQTVSARSLETGGLIWRTEIPVPDGQGVVIDGRYRFPVAGDYFGTIDLADGRLSIPQVVQQAIPVEDNVLLRERRLRNLFAVGDQLWEVSLDGLRELPVSGEELSSQTGLTELEAALGEETNDRLWVAIESAQSQESLSARDRSAMVLALLELLKDPTTTDLAREVLSELNLTANEQAEFFRRRCQVAMKLDSWPELCRTLREAAKADLHGHLRTAEDVRCRIDRWSQSRLNQLDSESPQRSDRLVSKIREQFESNPMTSTADQLQWLRWLEATPLHADILFAEVAPPTNLTEWVRLQSALIRATTGDEPGMRAGAYAALVALHKMRKDNPGGEFWRDQLVSLPGDLALPQGGTVADWLAQNSSSKESEETSVTTWPERIPRVTAKSRSSSRVFFSQIPVTNLAGDLFSHLNVEIDWPGCQGVRYSGTRWTQEWMGYLPSTSRFLRPQHDLTHGWGIGDLLIFQTGSELFGLTPFDLSGARSSNRLWPPAKQAVDTLGDVSNIKLSFVEQQLPQRAGFHEVDFRRLNEFGHPAVSVGPVDAGLMCLQQQGMLVAIDPTTGDELWRRYHVPPRAWHFGDRRGIAQISEGESTVSVFSPLDGRLVAKRDSPVSPEEIVWSQGGRVLCIRDAMNTDPQSSPGVQLEFFDLITGVSQWDRESSPGCVPFQIDHRWVGLLELSGNLHVINLETGHDEHSIELEIPEQVEQVACSLGSDDLLVAISGPVEDPWLTNAPQRQRGYRRIYLDGSLLSLNAETARLRWQKPMSSTVFPLDQPVDFPVFVTAESRYPQHPMDEGGEFSGVRGSHGSVLRVYDRRTGEQLYENESLNPINVNYVFHCRSDIEQLVLRTRNTLVEFDFSKPVNESAESTE